MLDANIPKTGAVRRKLLLGVLSSPATVFPFVGGVTAFLGTWALDVRPDLGILAAFLGILGAGGAFITQLLLGGDSRGLGVRPYRAKACASLPTVARPRLRPTANNRGAERTPCRIAGHQTRPLSARPEEAAPSARRLCAIRPPEGKRTSGCRFRLLRRRSLLLIRECVFAT